MIQETSMEAFFAHTPEKLAKDYANIYRALKVIQPANYEEIAMYLHWEEINKVSRRLKEMHFKNMIEPTGETSITSRKKRSRTWKCTEIPQSND